MQYGTPSLPSFVNADVYEDVVALGPLNATMKLGVATGMSSNQANKRSQGILGLAFPGITVIKQQPPFFFALMEQVLECIPRSGSESLLKA